MQYSLKQSCLFINLFAFLCFKNAFQYQLHLLPFSPRLLSCQHCNFNKENFVFGLEGHRSKMKGYSCEKVKNTFIRKPKRKSFFFFFTKNRRSRIYHYFLIKKWKSKIYHYFFIKIGWAHFKVAEDAHMKLNGIEEMQWKQFVPKTVINQLKNNFFTSATWRLSIWPHRLQLEHNAFIFLIWCNIICATSVTSRWAQPFLTASSLEQSSKLLFVCPSFFSACQFLKI